MANLTSYFKTGGFMANSLFKKITYRIALILAVICIACFSLSFFTACKDSETKKEDSNSSYSYQSTDTTPISNMDFSFGVVDATYSSFPKTSVTGWSRAVDNSAKTSNVTSGVINVNDSAWEELMSTLYSNSTFLSYLKYYNGESNFDLEVKSAIRAEKEDNTYEPTSAEIKEYVIKNIIPDFFKNPEKSPNASDNNVFMLNNVTTSSEFGLGTAQKITSSSTVTLEKGKYAKISVWVKTLNIKGNNADGDFGANIRLTNSFKGNTQAQFQINNIVADEWTQYNVYIKADKNYDSTISLILGLGYGLGSNANALYYTEGTVFFDNIEYSVLTEEEYNDLSLSAIETSLSYGKTEAYENKANLNGDNFNYLYDMTLDSSLSSYLFDTSIAVTHDYTKSDVTKDTTPISSKTLFDTDSETVPTISDKIELDLTHSAYTVTLKSDSFKLAPETYCLIYFYVTNELSLFGSTDIKVNVYDEFNGVSKKREALATISSPSEEPQLCTILVKNNFFEGDFSEERSFFLTIEIGPSANKIATTANKSDYASGKVTISMPKTATGKTYQFVRDIDHKDTTEKTENYDLYSFFSSNASGTTSLYAGYDNDYSSDVEQKNSFPLSPANSDMGAIISAPANVSEYTGIVSNHIFVTNEGDNLETKTNTRSGNNGDGNGNFAGIINTKYLSTYDHLGINISNALLNAYNEDIQPIMIYNKDAENGHYGYIGNSISISSSSFAKISVTLRVVDSAKAYVYLVNTSNESKEVMSFPSFTENTDGVKEIVGKTANSLPFSFEITNSLMDEDGWVTVEFYIATGTNSKDFRIEVWNGGRDGKSETESTGFVFIKNISVNTASAFTEPSRWQDAFTDSSSVLFGLKNKIDNKYLYKQTLTEIEEKYNKSHSEKVSYDAKIIWADNDTMIYSIFNSLEPVEVNPYDKEVKPSSNENGCGCTSNADPSTFWLSFSSILLAVVLLLAIIALFVKNLRRKSKANKSDAKSHYKIKSRAKVLKDLKANKEYLEEQEKNEQLSEETEEENAVEDSEQVEVTEEPTQESEEEPKQENLDDYVYGEVQDFGEQETTNTENELPEEDKKD